MGSLESYLKHVMKEERSIVYAPDLSRCIGVADDVFKGHVDQNFLKPDLNIPSMATEPTQAHFFEITKKVSLAHIFSRRIYWEQNQVVEFCRSLPNKLLGVYHSTLFPTKFGGNVLLNQSNTCIVFVAVGEDGLLSPRLCPFDLKDQIWGYPRDIIVFPESL